ncbi:MAG: NAD(+)/NADH kinase [Deltaproteobacteria bacterium]|nr:NAD(+)/NADH kinase [Deltaproteobacteria bacterium]
MASVGIIANPRAGKDIRRLVAHGSVLDTQEKVYIVRRAILGLNGASVDEVVFLPDPVGIGHKALSGITETVRIKPRFLDMPVYDEAADSTRAARLMREQGVACVIVIGGDGTSRVVAKASGDLPLIALSTGTNNAFPRFLESTLAGLAAGHYAVRQLAWAEFTTPTKRFNLYRNGQLEDVALVDVAVCDYQFVGARALWEVERLKELFLTQGQPMNIGMASIGGMIYPIRPQEDGGLYLQLGNGGRTITAAIAPGLVATVGIRNHAIMCQGHRLPVTFVPSILALDGEREIVVKAEDRWEVELSWEGPRLLDIEKVMNAARKG